MALTSIKTAHAAIHGLDVIVEEGQKIYVRAAACSHGCRADAARAIRCDRRKLSRLLAPSSSVLEEVEGPDLWSPQCVPGKSIKDVKREIEIILVCAVLKLECARRIARFYGVDESRIRRILRLAGLSLPKARLK